MWKWTPPYDIHCGESKRYYLLGLQQYENDSTYGDELYVVCCRGVLDHRNVTHTWFFDIQIVIQRVVDFVRS